MDDPRWFKRLITQELQFLTANLSISLDFLIYFLDSKVLTRFMVAKICSLPTDSNRNERFLLYLSRRNPVVAPRLFAEALHLSKQENILKRLSLLQGLIRTDKLSVEAISLIEKPQAVKRFEEAFAVQCGYLPRQDDVVLKYYLTKKFGSSPLEEFYESPPGLCVIINNKDFENNPRALRQGSEIDVRKCEQCFEALNYTILRFDNLTYNGFLVAFKKVRDTIEDGPFKSLVMIIMSHGVVDHVQTTDGRLLNIKFEICCSFSSEKCPTLWDLPKVFLIQACQDVNSAVPPPPCRDYSDCSLADMLVCCATAPGSAATRYLVPDLGSPFIGRITEVAKEWGHIMTIRDVLLEVNNYVEKVNQKLGSHPNEISSVILNTLKKDFMFKYPSNSNL